jgi:hypothetical protein
MTWRSALVTVLLAVAAPASAEKAMPRGGSDTAGSDAEARHPATSPTSAPTPEPTSAPVHSPRDWSPAPTPDPTATPEPTRTPEPAATPDRSDAERRHPWPSFESTPEPAPERRPPPRGHGRRDRERWWPDQEVEAPPSRPDRRGLASVRVLAYPTDTPVLVDGVVAGLVDDFNGLLQRLYVTPGCREIALQRPGYRTHRVRFLLRPGKTEQIKHEMRPGAAEDPLDDRSRGACDARPWRSESGQGLSWTGDNPAPPLACLKLQNQWLNLR